VAYLPIGFTADEERELLETSRATWKAAEKDAAFRAAGLAVAVGGFFLTLAKLGEVFRQRRGGSS